MEVRRRGIVEADGGVLSGILGREEQEEVEEEDQIEEEK